MHKKISSRLAIGVVALVAILFGMAILVKSGFFEKNYDFNVNNTPLAKEDKNKEEKISCKDRYYKGEAEINGWYLDSEEGWLLVVSDDDMEKLPRFDGTEEYKAKNKKIRLVDATSQVEKKLKATSEKKPTKITITGFASKCNGVPLASLEYKEGIFEKYPNM